MSPLSLFRSDVSYTEAERTIMDFIVVCPAEFLVMSIQQLSARLGISDAARDLRRNGLAVCSARGV